VTASWQQSDQQLSQEQIGDDMVRQFGRSWLWCLLIGSVAFVGAGFFTLVVAPHERFESIESIVFFGLCAIVLVFMIHRSRRLSS